MTLSDQYLANALKQIQKATEELKESNDMAEEIYKAHLIENGGIVDGFIPKREKEQFPREPIKPVGYDRDPQND